MDATNVALLGGAALCAGAAVWLALPKSRRARAKARLVALRDEAAARMQPVPFAEPVSEYTGVTLSEWRAGRRTDRAGRQFAAARGTLGIPAPDVTLHDTIESAVAACDIDSDRAHGWPDGTTAEMGSTRETAVPVVDEYPTAVLALDCESSGHAHGRYVDEPGECVLADSEPLDAGSVPEHSKDIFGRAGATEEWADALRNAPEGRLTPVGIPTHTSDDFTDDEIIAAEVATWFYQGNDELELIRQRWLNNNASTIRAQYTEHYGADAGVRAERGFRKSMRWLDERELAIAADHDEYVEVLVEEITAELELLVSA